jgi:hypothetical protein
VLGGKIMIAEFLGKEKRAHKRLRMNCTVSYRMNEPLTARFMVGSNDIKAEMVDISKGGMALVTNYDIPVSTVLSMRFTLLKIKEELSTFSGPMEITGQVKSNLPLEGHGHRLGICFSAMKKIEVS